MNEHERIQLVGHIAQLEQAVRANDEAAATRAREWITTELERLTTPAASVVGIETDEGTVFYGV